MKMHALPGLALAGLSFAFLAACGGGAGEPPAPVEPAKAPSAVAAADAEAAVALFQEEACTVCHGENAEGVEGAGPALRDLAPYWNEERLMAYLADPQGFRAANPDFEERREERYDLEMPAFDYLSEEQRRQLAGWLLAR